MIKATRVGNTIVCVINNAIYRKTVEDDSQLLELYERLLSTDETDSEQINRIKTLLAPEKTAEEIRVEKEVEKLEKEAVEQESLLEWMQDIRDFGDDKFEVDGSKLYMKGIKITLPDFLAMEFASRRDNAEDFAALMNFWRLCALNPDPRCREDLYKFLINNDMTVTPSGYFVAYRNVNIKEEGNRELNDFIVKKWSKVKRWKKSPSNYVIVENEDDTFECIKTVKLKNWHREVGNLQDLYEGLSSNSDQTVYTDAHSGTTTVVIGQPVSIDRSECDANPDRTCSRGLHAANSDWLRGGYFGSQGLAVLINPTHVIAVPYTDGGKLRCCEYLPICTIEFDEDDRVIPFETATFEYEYAEYTAEELEKLCETANFESLKEHEIIPKEIDIKSLQNILNDTVTNLDEMNKALEGKIVNV